MKITLHITNLLLLFSFLKSVCIAFCNNTEDKLITGEFTGSEADFEVRPNLFIDKDRLLGTQSKSQHKKPFTYGNGPYGPAHWSKLYPKCGGKHQSPINLDLSSLKLVSLSPLKWNSLYDDLPSKISVANIHNTLEVTVNFKDNGVPTIQGGPLTHPYAMHSLHFHWSGGNHKGSEHTINKKSFPMEMHVVHHRSDMNFSIAKTQEKGLCVVGYIFEIGEKCNEALSNILDATDQVMLEPEIPFELTNLFRLDSLLDKVYTDYVTYSGSLTTPPCYESVVWIISPYTLTVNRKQLEKFRSVSLAANGFGDNYRNVQPLNGRVVQFIKRDSA